jgi:hypothetical protein
MQAIRRIITAIFVVLAVTGYSQVPDTETFSLQDAVDEVNPSSDDLVTCFNESVINGYDPDYIPSGFDPDASDKSGYELYYFRNYCGPWNVRCYSYVQDISSYGKVRAVFFKPDGTEMYEGYNPLSGNSQVIEYNLSTAWDISTASVADSFETEITKTSGLYIGDNGTKMYDTGYETDYIYQYTLVKAWEVWSASKDAIHFVDTPSPADVQFKPDGTEMYVLGSDETGSGVYQYNLSTAWDINSASFDVSLTPVQGGASSRGIYFKDDGTRMFEVDHSDNIIYQYNLSVSWDVSSASVVDSININNNSPRPQGIYVKDDGTRLFIGDLEKLIIEYEN